MFIKVLSYKYFILTTLSLILTANSGCSNNQVEEEKIMIPENKTAAPAKLEFLKKIHDFGTLKQGEVVEYAFKFKNTGGNALKILNVKTDCGCTVPKYNKNLIMPGKDGKLKIIFNTKGLRNNQYKTINIKATGINNEVSLIITAFIESNY